jgi:Spy/CpxP family protein refolding chaperone
VSSNLSDFMQTLEDLRALFVEPHELLSLTADERAQLEELHGDARLKAQWWRRRREREAV